MIVLFTPRHHRAHAYSKTVGPALTERGFTFLGIPTVPFFLPWYRFVRHARTLCIEHIAEKIIMTLPARLLGIKVFWIEARLIDKSLRGRLLLWCYRLLSRFATIVTASRAIRQQLIDRGISAECMHVISPGIALEAHGVQESVFSALATAKTKRRAGFAIGAISALEKDKGLEYLLQAFKIARESIPDLHLTIVGHGTEKTALQWLSKKLGIAEHVLFVGWQDDAERWLANFDLVIAPQIRKEGFGEFLLLAMAYKKPIIATDVGSFPEIIERRKTGMIIEAGNATMLAEAIINLYHHPEWREEMGRKARERVEEHFSLPQMVNAWDVLLRHEK